MRCVREFQSVRHGPVFAPETDEVFPTLSLQVGQVIAGLIPSVRQKDNRAGNGRAVHHGAQGRFLILFVSFLDNYVHINAILQIIKRIQIPKIPAVLTLCPRPVGGGIPGIRSGLHKAK